VEIVGADNMDEATANEIIMAARAHWFADDADGEAGETADAVDGVAGEADHD
jgi:N utilization substance protein A